MASPSSCSARAMRRWQLSAMALGTPAKRNNPPSAAVASAALRNSALPNSTLLNSECCKRSRKGINVLLRALPWVWLGFCASLGDVTQAQEKCRARTRKVTKQELEAEEREAQRIALRLVRPRDLTSFDEDLARRMFAILAVVIVIIPVALGAPTMLVFIPPTMIVAPAVVARLAQFASRMVRLLAFAPMALDRFMEMMIRLRDSLLATIASGAQTRRGAEI